MREPYENVEEAMMGWGTAYAKSLQQGRASCVGMEGRCACLCWGVWQEGPCEQQNVGSSWLLGEVRTSQVYQNSSKYSEYGLNCIPELFFFFFWKSSREVIAEGHRCKNKINKIKLSEVVPTIVQTGGKRV